MWQHPPQPRRPLPTRPLHHSSTRPALREPLLDPRRLRGFAAPFTNADGVNAAHADLIGSLSLASDAAGNIYIAAGRSPT
jgi:hypothetical protein